MRTRVRVTLACAALTAVALTAGGLVVTARHTVTPVNQAVTAPATSTPASSVNTPTETPTPSTTVSAPALDPDELADAVSDAVKHAVPGTELGLAIFDRQTGETLAEADPGKRFYTASVVKLLIALDAVYDNGWQVPDDDLAEDLTTMLAGSNDSIASRLWEDDGGVTIVSRMADLIGLDDTVPPSDPGQWGMTWTSADDVVQIYEYLDDTVPDEVARPIVDALAAARQPADDGFAQYFGIPDGLPGVDWAVKQGWMILRSSVVLDTTGVVGSRYVVALLTDMPRATSWAKGRAAVTAGIAATAPVLGTAS
ncbi:hypothetical protein [Amycolatopsis sp. H20-H5]|uniref:hypothetical protein n=1 Tax=Amycolatopsis sp. H20-H5 TaxID=3046309 RepID=UPI002DB8F24E|nr:hypothetical protein [Amycolatopsis sp. H20-H5]MEC3973974.1 hypothetical protein [Amycolatopsis sp. H20-H5]